VVCVLRSGGQYRAQHARRLYKQVQQFAPHGTEFRCLTDMAKELAPLNVPALPLTTDWPGWWAKAEAWYVKGPTLYLDLDVTIMRDLTPLLEACAAHELIILRDFRSRFDWVDSSVVGWRGSLEKLTRRFAEAPEAWMWKYAVGLAHSQINRFGDQAFIADQWYGPVAYWQEVLPLHILSYKKQWRPAKKWARVDRSQCRILVYHSEPKPWDLSPTA
jgi:hypothetical protein